jgi:predicted nucleic acid-binding protein
MVACVNGHPSATLFYLAVIRLGPPRFSRLTAVTMLSGCTSDADRALVLRYLATSQVEELTDAIARRAVDLLTAIPLPTLLTPADAIIAATAIEQSLPLYTLDPARFATVPGLAAVRPY